MELVETLVVGVDLTLAGPHEE